MEGIPGLARPLKTDEVAGVVRVHEVLPDQCPIVWDE